MSNTILETLKSIRRKISLIDEQLITLLSERRKLSKTVSEEKKLIEKPLRDQVREKELLESLVDKASDLGLDAYYITQIYSLIIEDSVKYQQDYLQAIRHPEIKNNETKDIAILGGKGSYSYLAAKKYFTNSDNDYHPCSSFEEIINCVEEGKVNYGVIPIENTTSGGITEVYDLLLDSQLSIIGEEKYPIKHCLVGNETSSLEEITEIVSHPQPSKQCNKILRSLTSSRMTLVPSTTHALKYVKESNSPNIAAIASQESAQIFGLKVLRHNLANQLENTTRFYIIAKKPIDVSMAVQCKTSIALTTGQSPGSLANVLSQFHDADIPLSKLESRPIPSKPWEQMFYIDLEGNIKQQKVKNTLNELAKECSFLRVFGSYPTQDISATQISSQAIAQARVKSMQKTQTSSSVDERKKLNKSDRIQLANRAYKSKNTKIQVKDLIIGGENFTIIAGTNKEQIQDGLKQAIDSGIAIFRLPTKQLSNNAELNIGYLNQVKQAQSVYSIPIVAEIKSSDWVKTLVHYVDLLEVSVNSIKDTSLLSALGKVNCPVILNRTSDMRIEEILGAAEIILSQGNLQVIICETAVLSESNKKANSLNINSIIELINLTHLPVIVNPADALSSLQNLIPLTKAIRAVKAKGIILNVEDSNTRISSKQKFHLNHSSIAELITNLE